jgi:hypothetical protein
MCMGGGKVDPDNSCECGRPAIRYSGQELICSSLACEASALTPTPTMDVVTVKEISGYDTVTGEWMTPYGHSGCFTGM